MDAHVIELDLEQVTARLAALTIHTNTDLALHMRRMADLYGHTIAHDPDGDWPPLLIVQFDDGTTKIPDLPWHIGNSERGKQTLARVIGETLTLDIVKRVGLLMSAWTITVEPNADGSAVDLADRPMPADHPDRAETLVLHVVDQDSDQSWRAPITRVGLTGRCPRLGEWTMDTDAARTEGRWPDALMRVRENRSMSTIIDDTMRNIMGGGA